MSTKFSLHYLFIHTLLSIGVGLFCGVTSIIFLGFIGIEIVKIYHLGVVAIFSIVAFILLLYGASKYEITMADTV